MRIHPPGRRTITDERLLAAAKADNEDLLLDVFGDSKPFDINYQDGFVRIYAQISAHSHRPAPEDLVIQVLRSDLPSPRLPQLKTEPFACGSD